MGSVAVTREELAEQLQEQLMALKSSGAAFDHGQTWEAKRIATAVRVLVHDKPGAPSLLKQLGLAERHFLTSAPPVDPQNLMPQSGLLMIGLKKSGGEFLPALDERPMAFIALDDWWAGEVVWDRTNPPFSRRDLVLHMANKDGGAHVDPRVPAAYHTLKNGAMGWKFSGKSARQPERFALRQIGHEMIKSLDPKYRRTLVKDGFDMLVSDAGARVGNSSPSPRENMVDYRASSPEDPCPCNSGSSFRLCHQSGAAKAEGPN